MAKTNAIATLISAATNNTAGSTTRGTIDLRAIDGGNLTVKVTNGATGPTVEAQIRILVAHNTGSTPSAGSAGTDWKTIFVAGCGTVNNAITEVPFEFGPGYLHLEVEITGNTAQTVVCEAFASTIAY